MLVIDMPPAILGRIARVQRFSTQDGPGIRTTVFVKGCPLHCSWCHNPETVGPDPELMFFEERCRLCGACSAACPEGAHVVNPQGGHRFDRSRCRLHLRCAAVCPFGALEGTLKRVTVAQVWETVRQDEAYYRNSGGGVTISGGEPLLQPEFTGALLEAAGRSGIHTAVDTCLHAPWQVIAGLSPVVDLWLVDVKLINQARHRRYTGSTNALLLNNLKRLCSLQRVSVWIRIPLIESVNTDPENLGGTVELLKGLDRVSRIELLPYHSLGVDKQKSLGKRPAEGFAAPPPALVRGFAERLRAEKLPVYFKE
jgi:pyruvate formate lyase activating enzyme